MGEASRRKWVQRAMRMRAPRASGPVDAGVWTPVSGAKYTEARGADSNMYAWVGDTPPPGYLEPPSGPPMVVTKVDRKRKVITVG